MGFFELLGYVPMEELKRARNERDKYRMQNNKVCDVVARQVMRNGNEVTVFYEIKRIVYPKSQIRINDYCSKQ